MGLMDHLHVKMWPQIIRIWRMCIRNLVACWKITYHNLWLCKLKLHFGNHTTKLQFFWVFLLWIMIYLWILKIHKCAIYVICRSKKMVGNVLAQSFFWRKGWLSIPKLMGTFPWKLMLILHIPSCLLKKKVQVVEKLIVVDVKIIHNNMGKKGWAI